MDQEPLDQPRKSKIPEGRIGCVPCKVDDRVLYHEQGIMEGKVMEISPSGERVKMGPLPRWISAYQVVEVLTLEK